MSDYDYGYTEKQGQYLAFIYNYTIINGRPPAEADMQRFFRVSPPAVHQIDQLPYLKEPSSRSHRREQAMPSGVQIYQIKVTLRGSKPPIWRRILVRSDITLQKLHYILQVTMGWTNSHLHQFIVGQMVYGVPNLNWGFAEEIDESQVRLDQIATGEGFKFRYEYDFGDSWEHALLVEKVLEPEPGQGYPVCIKGRRACPPEDTGGIWTYNYLLESIRNPEHPDYPGNEDFLEWVGEEFDPEAFDLEETNEILRDLR